MTAVRRWCGVGLFGVAALASSCSDDGEADGPVYETAEQVAEALGCVDTFEADGLTETAYGFTADPGGCIVDGHEVGFVVVGEAGYDDDIRDSFEVLMCFDREPTDGVDTFYAHGPRWMAYSEDEGDGQQAADLAADLLGGEVASFGCGG